MLRLCAGIESELAYGLGARSDVNPEIVMGTIKCPRHFLLLGCASVALFLAARFPRPPFAYDRFFFLCGVSGALHAIAVVLALQSKSSVLSCFGFVAAAAALSIAAPLSASAVLDLFRPSDPVSALFVGLALTSATGAALYWGLVRLLWINSLSAWNLLVTVGACTSASLLAVFAASPMPMLHDIFVPTFWWFGFSASVASADRNKLA